MFHLSFFQRSELDSFSWEKRDDGFFAFSNNENVAYSGGEGVSVGILDVSNVETSWVLLHVLENTDSTDVVSTNGQH